MADLETAFMKNPITFMRTHPLSPPNGNAGTAPLHTWDSHGMNFKGGSHQRISVKDGQQRQVVSFLPKSGFPGTVTFDLSSRPVPRFAEGVLRTWWLPWESHSLVRLRIPEVPTSVVDVDEHDYPRFFMTAGLSGCSVMVEGPPHSPTVYHAGFNEVKLARPSDLFWEEQLQNARSQLGQDPFAPIHSNHKKDYLIADTPEAKRFVDWKESSSTDGFKIDLLECFGSVVGVRYGRHWSFYLQSNAVTQKLEFLKRRDVDVRSNSGFKGYSDRRDGGVVTKVKTIEKNTLGMNKTVRTYVKRTGVATSVLNVSEYYPRRTFSADFAGRITVRS